MANKKLAESPRVLISRQALNEWEAAAGAVSPVCQAADFSVPGSPNPDSAAISGANDPAAGSVPAPALALARTKKEPGPDCSGPGIYLATTYSHKTYRLTTIGAAAFHFRVRNGTGWFHHALVTRGQFWGRRRVPLISKLGLWGPEGIVDCRSWILLIFDP